MFGKLFKRRDSRPPLERAVENLRQGDTLAAENIVREAVGEAVRQHGADSPQAASAHNDLAMILMNLNRVPQAIAALEAACKTTPPADREGYKDWLTYQNNLAELLCAAERYDEAEAVYRENVNGRLTFYGREHAGYAFGVEPLARLLMDQGRVEEALPLLSEVVQNFYKNRHERIMGALVLRAEALKRAGDPTPPFAGLDGTPDQLAVGVVEAAVQRLGEGDPVAHRAVLADLREFVRERLGENHQAYQQVLAAIVEQERQLGKEAGDIARRLDALQDYLRIQDRTGDARTRTDALQGLALAQSEAGDEAAAAATYARAVTEAERTGNAGLLSNVLRNYGLQLRDAGRQEDAESVLRRAVTVVQKGRDAEMQGRAECALGIFLQHGGRLDEAKPFLEAAIGRLPNGHPDGLVARSHHQAIVTGGSCGCGDMESVMNDAFREFLREWLPEGLRDDIRIERKEDGLSLTLLSERSLTDAEAEELYRIVEHATEAFKKRLTEEGPYR